ncbi:hypothetical protein SRHO_G00083680 [Serrasalmus rhombeus]
MTTTMFEDEDLMKMLKEKQYDLVLTDPAWGTAVLLAHYLKPVVLNVADIWLKTVDYVFKFTRPTKPSIVYIANFQCQPTKPLPQDLEDFVQSSARLSAATAATLPKKTQTSACSRWRLPKRCFIQFP